MNNPAVKWGVYLAAFWVIYSTVLGFVAPNLLFHMGLGFLIGLAAPIFCMIKAANEFKVMEEGYLSFGEALKNTFLVFAIGSLVSVLYDYILVNFIKPDLVEVQKEAIMGVGDWFANIMSSNEEAAEQIREQYELAAEESANQSFGSVMIGYMMSLIFGFILSLIISAIVKKTD